jgi:hypothetical protein
LKKRRQLLFEYNNVRSLTVQHRAVIAYPIFLIRAATLI